VSPRSPLRGDELPEILVPPPGPRSRAAAKRLRRAEGAAIWGREESPIVWSRARGAAVEDLDGNRYLDFTSGFGVVSLGHSAPEVKRAVSAQAGRLTQGLGDLMPHRERERVVRALAKLGGPCDRVLLASTGSEAVELALKTAALATGRRRFVAFQGGYHGDTYGALAATSHPPAPAPIAAQVAPLAIHVPYPYPYRCALESTCGGSGCDLRCLEQAFQTIDRELEGPDPPGAVIVEPIQGRAGGIIPPLEFLPRLCAGARERGLVVIYDEVLTGACRTGSFWAWERSGPEAAPDLICAGKGLGGGVAIAALLGRRKLMDVWSRHVGPSGEAPHASTFYAHPLACAGTLAALKRLGSPGFGAEIARKGDLLAQALATMAGRHALVGDTRVAGLLATIELVSSRVGREPARDRMAAIVAALAEDGILVLPSGLHDNALMLLPPLTITDEQLGHGLNALDRALAPSG
jgi:4-aminobutyrate aminotransferase / (S)-3-amino-2-methylpropionate transaminase / 5-aminovalerate transaminase